MYNSFSTVPEPTPPNEANFCTSLTRVSCLLRCYALSLFFSPSNVPFTLAAAASAINVTFSWLGSSNARMRPIFALGNLIGHWEKRESSSFAFGNSIGSKSATSRSVFASIKGRKLAGQVAHTLGFLSLSTFISFHHHRLLKWARKYAEDML